MSRQSERFPSLREPAIKPFLTQLPAAAYLSPIFQFYFILLLLFLLYPWSTFLFLPTRIGVGGGCGGGGRIGFQKLKKIPSERCEQTVIYVAGDGSSFLEFVGPCLVVCVIFPLKIFHVIRVYGF